MNIIKDNCLVYDDRFKFSILFTLYTGLRIGELCALKKLDFNLNDKELTINKTLLRIKDTKDENKKTKVICNNAKTINSIRVIPIANNLILYLEKYLSTMNDNDYFLTGNNKFIEPRVYYSKYLKILEILNIKKHTFHSLRHTFASYAIEKNMDVKALSEILGHSSITITLSLYVHPSIEYKKDYINKIFN